MPRAIGLLCLIVASIVDTAENARNVVNGVEAKIIGGRPIDIRHRPFMLSLHNDHEFVCGASILSRHWGITAHHCLVSVASTNYYVRAGSIKPNEGGTVHKLTRIQLYNETAYSYPYWFSALLYHDIALFRVSPRFRFTGKIRPARLPGETARPPRTLHVSGWGYTGLSNVDGANEVLMSVRVSHVPHEVCVKATPEYAALVKRDCHLCYGSPGRDSCYGDSGGPLAGRYTIHGVVSFGHNCGQVAGVYVKVSYYRRWIKDTIKR